MLRRALALERTRAKTELQEPDVAMTSERRAYQRADGDALDQPLGWVDPSNPLDCEARAEKRPLRAALREETQVRPVEDGYIPVLTIPPHDQFVQVVEIPHVRNRTREMRTVAHPRSDRGEKPDAVRHVRDRVIADDELEVARWNFVDDPLTSAVKNFVQRLRRRCGGGLAGLAPQNSQSSFR